jgi:hypothetical protein
MKKMIFLKSCALLFCQFESVQANESPFRTWTSADGQTVEARMEAASFDRVTIVNRAGNQFTLPLERLSQEDRDWIPAERLRLLVPRLDPEMRAPAAANSNGTLFLKFELFAMGRREWQALVGLGLVENPPQDLRADGEVSKRISDRIRQGMGIRSVGTLDWLSPVALGYPASEQAIGNYLLEPNLTGFLQQALPPGVENQAPHLAYLAMDLGLRQRGGRIVGTFTGGGVFQEPGESLFIPMSRPTGGNNYYLLKITLDGVLHHTRRGIPGTVPGVRPSARGGAANTTLPEGRQLEEKLKALRIPEMRFQSTPPADVFAFLAAATREDDPQGRGVEFDFRPQAGSRSPRPVTLAVRGISVFDALGLATELTGLSYRIEEHRVVIE